MAHLKSLSLAFLEEWKSLKHRPGVCKFNESSICRCWKLYVILEQRNKIKFFINDKFWKYF